MRLPARFQSRSPARCSRLAQGPRRTCLAEVPDEVAQPKGKPLPPAAQAVRRCLADLVNTEGKPLPRGGLFPAAPGLRGVPEKRLYEECDTRRVSTAEDKETRGKAVRREVRRLLEAGAIVTRDGLVWLTDPKR